MIITQFVTLCYYQVPIFKNVDVAFLKLVALACKPVFFLSGQCILKKGDLGDAVSIYET